jgi:hypothetical protein
MMATLQEAYRLIEQEITAVRQLRDAQLAALATAKGSVEAAMKSYGVVTTTSNTTTLPPLTAPARKPEALTTPDRKPRRAEYGLVRTPLADIVLEVLREVREKPLSAKEVMIRCLKKGWYPKTERRGHAVQAVLRQLREDAVVRRLGKRRHYRYQLRG